MSVITEGFGSVTWWGFSPALDLISFLENLQQSLPVAGNTLNILLVGGADLRHVMQTLAKTHQKQNLNLHFYIIESNLEVLSRHMLFLSLLAEPPHKIGLREKTELFLELYGNTLIRSHTVQYIRETANILIKMITDMDYLQTILPILDVSLLKFKERDMMEGIFKFWRNPDEKSFEIEHHWENRLRHYLAQRYDSRSGVFDWDYHMKLQEMAPTISMREYGHWREVGVAFQLRDDAPYENTNRTLASGSVIKHRQEQIACRGYWGDIVNSPYITFGTVCENKDMLKKANEKYTKSCQEICEYNVQTLIHILLIGAPPSFPPPPSSSNGVTLEVTEEVEDEIKDEREKDAYNTSGSPLLNGTCRITFLPLNSANEIGKKGKFQKLFHCAFFSNSMVHNLLGGIEATFTDDCVLICETTRYMVDLKDEHNDMYVKKITGMADSIGYKNHIEVNQELAVTAFTQ